MLVPTRRLIEACQLHLPPARAPVSARAAREIASPFCCLLDMRTLLTCPLSSLLTMPGTAEICRRQLDAQAATRKGHFRVRAYGVAFVLSQTARLLPLVGNAIHIQLPTGHRVSREARYGAPQPAARVHRRAVAMPRRVLSARMCRAGRNVVFTAVTRCEWWSSGGQMMPKKIYCIFGKISAR